MELRPSTSALGFYNYDCAPPDGCLFERFYSIAIEQMRSWGVEPTYVGASGDGYSGRLAKFKSRTRDKLVKTKFESIWSISINANPPGSDAPAYDSFVTLSFGYNDVARELLAYAVVNETFVELASARYEALAQALIDLCPWGFGHGFASTRDGNDPELYMLGANNGKVSREEQESLTIWYNTPSDVRMKSLRDLYPYNFLNEHQLDSPIGDGSTLRDLAQQLPGCSLTRLTEYGLYLWRISAEELPRAKHALAGTPLLLG